jgi:hypothetical protein
MHRSIDLRAVPGCGGIAQDIGRQRCGIADADAAVTERASRRQEQLTKLVTMTRRMANSVVVQSGDGQNGMACASSEGLTIRISHDKDSRMVAAVLPTTNRCHLPCDEAPITITSVRYFVTVSIKQSSGVPISTRRGAGQNVTIQCRGPFIRLIGINCRHDDRWPVPCFFLRQQQRHGTSSRQIPIGVP